MLAVIETDPDFRGLDVLALQEAGEHAGEPDAAAVAAALGPGYSHHQVTAHLLRGSVQANALVWNPGRLEVSGIAEVALPSRRETELPRHERAILSLVPLQPRAALVFDCRLHGLSARICVAHLDVLGYRHKLAQFETILADLRARPEVELTIVAGDFNTFRIARRPRWTRLRNLADEAGFDDLSAEIEWTHGFGPRRTRQKLDAIFLRCERSIGYRCWSPEVTGSDHLPVFADLEGWA